MMTYFTPANTNYRYNTADLCSMNSEVRYLLQEGQAYADEIGDTIPDYIIRQVMAEVQNRY